MNPFTWVVSRLEEPSTYAGIAGVVATFSFWPQAAAASQVIPVVGAALASVLAIILPEKGAQK
jgi:hypothetical protein